jgi:hypothetical protein
MTTQSRACDSFLRLLAEWYCTIRDSMELLAIVNCRFFIFKVHWIYIALN